MLLVSTLGMVGVVGSVGSVGLDRTSQVGRRYVARQGWKRGRMREI